MNNEQSLPTFWTGRRANKYNETDLRAGETRLRVKRWEFIESDSDRWGWVERDATLEDVRSLLMQNPELVDVLAQATVKPRG